MIVRVDGVEFTVDRNCSVIELELTPEDKANIANMAPDALHYFAFNELGEKRVAARIDELASVPMALSGHL